MTFFGIGHIRVNPRTVKHAKINTSINASRSGDGFISGNNLAKFLRQIGMTLCKKITMGC
jgi:hypothetical protein